MSTLQIGCLSFVAGALTGAFVATLAAMSAIRKFANKKFTNKAFAPTWKGMDK